MVHFLCPRSGERSYSFVGRALFRVQLRISGNGSPVSVRFLQPVMKFFANYRHLRRRFNPEPDTTARHSYHGYRYLIADKNSLPNFSTKYKHGPSRVQAAGSQKAETTTDPLSSLTPGAEEAKSAGQFIRGRRTQTTKESRFTGPGFSRTRTVNSSARTRSLTLRALHTATFLW